MFKRKIYDPMSNNKDIRKFKQPNEVSKHNYEVDFLISRKNKICPLEIKSSGYKTHRSLDVFTEKFSNRIMRRYLIGTKDFSKEKDIFCLPVYMTQFL